MNKIIIGSTTLVLSSLVVMSCKKQKEEDYKGRPNILLIMADDIAPHNFNCYNGKLSIQGIDKVAKELYGQPAPTPNIDEVANNGMVFTNAYAVSSVCTPSRYSILTGQYPGRSLHKDFIDDCPIDKPYNIAFNTLLTNENVTIHELLKNAGYYTGFVGKFHVGTLDFDSYDANKNIPDIDPDMDPAAPEADQLLKRYQQVLSKEVQRLTGADFVANVQWENPEAIPIKAVAKHHLEWLTQGAVDFFDTIPGDKPFFLHINTTALHGPNHSDNLKCDAHFSPGGRMDDSFRYHPTRASVFDRLTSMGLDTGKNVEDHIRHYQAGVVYFDDQVGAIMRKLKETGRADNTLVIISADHNTEPGKSTVYNKGVRVPFIAQWLNDIPAGSVCGQQVQLLDFLPTFTELANTEIPKNVKIDGISIVPAFRNEALERDYLYFEIGYTRAISNGNYKYIAMRFPRDFVSELKSGKRQYVTHYQSPTHAHPYIAMLCHPGYFAADQLYDLENDPYEQNNLAYHPDYYSVLKKMKNKLAQYTNSFRHPYSLEDTSFMVLPEYKNAAENTRERGTSFIDWWHRELNYPPGKNGDN